MQNKAPNIGLILSRKKLIGPLSSTTKVLPMMWTTTPKYPQLVINSEIPYLRTIGFSAQST